MDLFNEPVDVVSTATARSRGAQAIVVVISLVAIVVIPLLVIWALSMAVWGGVFLLFSAKSAEGFTITSVSCRSQSGSNSALLEVQLSALDKETYVGVEPVESEAMSIAAVTSFEGESIASLSREERRSLTALLAANGSSAVVGFEPTVLVVELTRTAPRDGIQLSEVTLEWAWGELAYFQRIPLHFQWTDDGCRATLDVPSAS
ncbi:hypothetical protein [Microcella sp.]|uniref:hypothetical protein n=1 Tax=Microcella sp. TaxID=1913979 RepID=UPI00299F5491|nr:hypothetical protein [Microcella sp.]MDX2026430.1 hypothetical protein [Microcella sp.]